jgi:hypothetical protein
LVAEERPNHAVSAGDARRYDELKAKGGELSYEPRGASLELYDLGHILGHKHPQTDATIRNQTQKVPVVFSRKVVR